MKHKKYLRKQVDGEDSENVSDEKDDEEQSSNLRYIKKEDETAEKEELNNNIRGQRLILDDEGKFDVNGGSSEQDLIRQKKSKKIHKTEAVTNPIITVVLRI